MKVYSIGRESGCDIIINDSTDVISRRHAILNVSPSGKMTIVDQSHNGTYVNGIRISPNVPVPVTRKDNVSFAHIARLDWNLVPKSNNIQKYIVIAVVALVVVIGSVFGFRALSGGGNNQEKIAITDTTTVADSTKKDSTQQDSITKKKDTEKKCASPKASQNKKSTKKEANKDVKKDNTPKKATEDTKKQTAKDKKSEAKKEEKNEETRRLH